MKELAAGISQFSEGYSGEGGGRSRGWEVREGRTAKAELAWTWFLEDLGQKGEMIKGAEKVSKGLSTVCTDWLTGPLSLQGKWIASTLPAQGSSGWLRLAGEKGKVGSWAAPGPPLIG